MDDGLGRIKISGGLMYDTKCGCRKCQRKHSTMFWTIVFLLIVIIALMMRQQRMI